METLQDKLERMADKITFEDVVSEMTNVYKKKNSDYGDSFTKSCDEFGLISPIIRMSDKLNRLKSLNKSELLLCDDERLEDTLLDLANYAVMTLVWIKNK